MAPTTPTADPQPAPGSVEGLKAHLAARICCAIHDAVRAEYRTYSRVNVHLPELTLCRDCAAIYVMAGGAVNSLEVTERPVT